MPDADPLWRYVYIVAYKVDGLTVEAGADVVIAEYPGLNARALVVSEGLEDHLVDADRQTAIANLLLNGLLGQSEEGEFDVRLAAQLARLHESRAELIAGAVALVFVAEGEVSPFELPSQRKIEDFVVGIGASPKEEVRAHHRSAINGLVASASLAAETVHGLQKIADAVTFRTADDTPMYIFDLKMGSARVSISRRATDETFELMAEFSMALEQDSTMLRPASLLTRSLQEKEDQLMSFLSAWSGLEILVNKAFPSYEKQALASASAPSRFIDRIQRVMKDKYGLADKFSLLAHGLTAEPKASEDVALFMELKEIRDQLMHGQDLAVSTLPIERTRGLLRTYLLLYLDGEWPRLVASTSDPKTC